MTGENCQGRHLPANDPFFPKRKKFLGQCFLSNPSYLDFEAEAISPSHKAILEIGGGDGRLTERLVTGSAKKVFVVEKDPIYAAMLRQKFAQNNVEVIEGDFLCLRPFKVDVVCGNLPYYISSAITFRLADWNFKRAVLMYQKEFCEKMLASGNDKSRLSFFSQYYFNMKPLLIVPQGAFSPRPKVDSMLIELLPKRPAPINPSTREIISMLFQHRPKALNASIRMACKRKGVGGCAAILEQLSGKFGTSKRIFEFSNEEILEIGNEIARFISAAKQEKN